MSGEVRNVAGIHDWCGRGG